MERQIIVWSLPSQKNKIAKGYPKAWGNCNLPLRFKFFVTEILKFLSYAVTESLHLESPIVPTIWHLFELILSTFHLPDFSHLFHSVPRSLFTKIFVYFCLPDPIAISQVTPVTFTHLGLLQALTLLRALSASLSVKLILASPCKISDKTTVFRAIA
jgi:hypothetical protein